MASHRLQIPAISKGIFSHKQQRCRQFYLLQVLTILETPAGQLFQIRNAREVKSPQIPKLSDIIKVFVINRSAYLQTLYVPYFTDSLFQQLIESTRLFDSQIGIDGKELIAQIIQPVSIVIGHISINVAGSINLLCLGY